MLRDISDVSITEAIGSDRSITPSGPYESDVILENFDLPAGAAALDGAEKATILNGFVTAGGNVSHLTYAETEGYAYGGKGVWQIGDYGTEYDPALNAYCNLTLTPNALADGWSDWTGARGAPARDW